MSLTTMTDELTETCQRLALGAKAASRTMAIARSAEKNGWLLHAAKDLHDNLDAILIENQRDVLAAPSYGLDEAATDRLTLNPKRIAAMSEGLRQVAALPDPVGEVREGHIRPNGLQVQKVGVPLGVIFFLYESRPNVTADAAALCVKSGNAVILRGGKEALHTNTILHRILTQSLTNFGLPTEAVSFVNTTNRDAVGHFLKMNGTIDLVIPRGGESLIRRVASEATMPVLKHFHGNCHVYVDRAADLQMADRIITNAKVQRPGVCNAVETVLVHADVAASFLPQLGATMLAHGVELRGCDVTRQYLPDIVAATDADFHEEFLRLVLAVKVVPSVDAAMDHIAHYGSQHTDAIITNDLPTSQRFVAGVDTAAVVVNASTRFNDGFELGLGAEIGISTDKFHARGPCGLRELTTYKYILTGTGQIRG
ncbi:MAG: glutamate-5-semialdehyde dehydrogenase [Fimbriiglobus sp.]